METPTPTPHCWLPPSRARADRILPPSLEAVRVAGTPELRLRLAVLENAVRDFQRHLSAHDERGERRLRNAERWFASADRCEPYGFERVCATLGVDANVVRGNLAHWRAEQFVRDARRWLERRIPPMSWSAA
jgi:hypothetical protein